MTGGWESAGVRLRPAGSLIDRAIAVLSSGPASTATLAREVLMLRGNPAAASAAVFALLGSDDRFRVDGSGVWSLAGQLELPLDRPLAEEEWAVVDVETTGGSPLHGHRIIEVGVVRLAGGRIVDRFETLVNPFRSIPPIVSSLTGISDHAVARAPAFDEIAHELTERLAGAVFVGHNAGFDWRFVSSEMRLSTGRVLSGRRLCTLRLARRILPQLPSRSLGALAHYYGIEMEVRHRALADAEATALLLLRLLDALADRGVLDWSGLEPYLRTRPPRRLRRRRARPRPMDIA